MKVGFLVALLVFAGEAIAQDASIERLSRLRPGLQVRVVPVQGAMVEGALEATGTTLVVRGSSSPHFFPIDNVRELWVRRSRARVASALVGIPAAMMLGGLSASWDNYGTTSPGGFSGFMYGAAIGGGVGAIVGALIGAPIRVWKKEWSRDSSIVVAGVEEPDSPARADTVSRQAADSVRVSGSTVPASPASPARTWEPRWVPAAQAGMLSGVGPSIAILVERSRYPWHGTGIEAGVLPGRSVQWGAQTVTFSTAYAGLATRRGFVGTKLTWNALLAGSQLKKEFSEFVEGSHTHWTERPRSVIVGLGMGIPMSRGGVDVRWLFPVMVDGGDTGLFNLTLRLPLR